MMLEIMLATAIVGACCGVIAAIVTWQLFTRADHAAEQQAREEQAADVQRREQAMDTYADEVTAYAASQWAAAHEMRVEAKLLKDEAAALHHKTIQALRSADEVFHQDEIATTITIERVD